MNGQEKDDEVYGAGNLSSAQFWEYDTRLGKRWNIDPKPITGISDYACFTNNPILFPDPNGDIVKYDKFRDRVNVFFGKLFNKEFRKKVDGFDKEADVYTFKKGEFGKDQLRTAPVCEGACNDGVQDNAIYYNNLGGLGGVIGLERRTKWVVEENSSSRNNESVTNITDNNVVPGSQMLVGTFSHPDYVKISTDVGVVTDGTIFNRGSSSDSYDPTKIADSQKGLIRNNAFQTITPYPVTSMKKDDGTTINGLVLQVPNNASILNITVTSRNSFTLNGGMGVSAEKPSIWRIQYQKYRTVFKYKLHR
jgi:hypothetical protein